MMPPGLGTRTTRPWKCQAMDRTERGPQPLEIRRPDFHIPTVDYWKRE